MQIEGLGFSVEGLRRDADEIEGCGGGNEAAQMRWAAFEIEHLRSELNFYVPEAHREVLKSIQELRAAYPGKSEADIIEILLKAAAAR